MNTPGVLTDDDRFTLLSELGDCEAALDALHHQEHLLAPYIDDGVWSDTYYYQQRVKQIKVMLGLTP
jgi:hypothetical protein